MDDTKVLMTRAAAIRDERWGRRVTFSPKVFVPITRLCRDSCGYCTFVETPATAPALYMSPDDVLDVARAGQAAGCTEALFSLGENPELRYPAARRWLDERGFASTVDYVVAMCALVQQETSLLPHSNAGAISAIDLGKLREVTVSQGMMIESLVPDLEAHRLAPDKTPERRLATLEAAGEQRIPFTTGILVGIGESEPDRIAALEAIAASHRRHGHVAEVIVQPFWPKQRTAMRRKGSAPVEEHLRAIALARIVLPPDVHVQAPPNLSEDFGALLDAGCDDWGGVSPVTADHINPERAWPDVERLREAATARGFELRARLPVHPEFVSSGWVTADQLRLLAG